MYKLIFVLNENKSGGNNGCEPGYFIRVITKSPPEPYRLKDDEVIYYTLQDLSEETRKALDKYLFTLTKQEKKKEEDIIPIPKDIAYDILLKLRNLNLSYVPLEGQGFGTEGISYKIKFGGCMHSVEFKWWMHAPEEWKDLEYVVSQIKSFVMILPG